MGGNPECPFEEGRMKEPWRIPAPAQNSVSGGSGCLSLRLAGCSSEGACPRSGQNQYGVVTPMTLPSRVCDGTVTVDNRGILAVT